MKILILGFNKLKLMPYANFYLEQIDFEKSEVHFVVWNRDLNENEMPERKNLHYHEFCDELSDAEPLKVKIGHFWKYRRFVCEILRAHKFDRIISLYPHPGLMVFDKLLLGYRRKYILDYRDSTYEANVVFGQAVKQFARNAALAYTSSDAFRKFLPEKGVEVITSHNILMDSLNHRDDRKTQLVPSEKIRIVFWGLLRDTDHNLQIIGRLGNDPRFELHYFGRLRETGERIKAYCSEHGIANVFLGGEYQPNDRYDFANRTDILHNTYHDDNMMLAMSNKYYDGIIFRIPQLCMKGSYMGKRCMEKSTGIALDPHDHDYADRLYAYYTSLDWAAFDRACDDDLEYIMQEYNYGASKIKELLNDEKYMNINNLTNIKGGGKSLLILLPESRKERRLAA